MEKQNRGLIAMALIVALVMIACNISVPGSNAVDQAATSVAGTVSVLAGTASAAITLIPYDLPTMEIPTLPPPPVSYPIRVAFVSPDNNLYTWADGMAAPLQLTFSGDVVTGIVSPDGALIVFTRYVDNTILSLDIINSDGTNLRTLLNAAGFSALPRPADSLGTEPNELKWIPNSHTLAMSTRITYEGPGLQVGDNLFIIDGDSGVSSTLLNAGSSWKFFYSPDGSKIAITNPTGMDIFNAAGTKIAGPLMTHSFVNTASEYAWVASPTWSSDGTSLAASNPPQEPWEDSPAPSSVWVVSSDGLTGGVTFSQAMPLMTGASVAISPDLTKILFYTRLGLPTDYTYTLHTANIDGSASTDYASGKFVGFPVWSRDNNHFFYSIGDPTSSTAFIGQVGSIPTAIADFNNAFDVKWIDENRYLVSASNAGQWRLLLGTVGSPTGLIYDSVSAYSNRLTFTVNR